MHSYQEWGGGISAHCNNQRTIPLECIDEGEVLVVAGISLEIAAGLYSVHRSVVKSP